MPELPEVEVCRRSLAPQLIGQQVSAATLRVPRLRHPVAPELPQLLLGQTLRDIGRRSKYLLFGFDSGTLIAHLGMSGNLRLMPPATPPQKHDHFDAQFADRLLRYTDPRRFGALVWTPATSAEALASHPLLAALGIEPLTPQFDGVWLHRALQKHRGPIKPVLMNASLLVGVGNIYAAESLFAAGISPLTAANQVSEESCIRLAAAIQQTLRAAIDAGGSSFRDYVHSDGSSGHFQLACAVYGRAGEACPRCQTPIASLRQAGRSTFWCPGCQS